MGVETKHHDWEEISWGMGAYFHQQLCTCLNELRDQLLLHADVDRQLSDLLLCLCQPPLGVLPWQALPWTEQWLPPPTDLCNMDSQVRKMSHFSSQVTEGQSDLRSIAKIWHSIAQSHPQLPPEHPALARSQQFKFLPNKSS